MNLIKFPIFICLLLNPPLTLFISNDLFQMIMLMLFSRSELDDGIEITFYFLTIDMLWTRPWIPHDCLFAMYFVINN